MEETRILTKEIQMSLDDKKTRKNNHVFVAANTREDAIEHYILPNILQMNSNYVITDPGGYIYNKTKRFMEEQGYGMQVFHLMDPENSLHFNPFHSVVEGERLIRGYSKGYQVAIEGPEKKHEAKRVIVQTKDRVVSGDGGEQGIISMVDTIFKATDCMVEHDDAAARKFEKHLLLALALYVAEIYEKRDRNLWKLLELIENVELLDTWMSELQNHNFASKAVRNYRIFQMGAEMIGEEHIVTSVCRRLQIFERDVLKALMQDSSIDFDAFGRERQVLFIISPEGMEPIVAMLVQQVEERLREYTERVCDNYRLPIPVTMILSMEYANLISDLNMRMVTSRKYNIGYSFIADVPNTHLQGAKDEWEFVADACDSFLYLGSTDEAARNYVSEQMRKSVQLKEDECILVIRGQAPVVGKKYDLTEHPRYKEI